MFKSHKGDAALEWILVASVGVLVLGLIVYNLATNAKTIGTATQTGMDTYAGSGS
jgi:hypothetical protein